MQVNHIAEGHDLGDLKRSTYCLERVRNASQAGTTLEERWRGGERSTPMTATDKMRLESVPGLQYS